MPLNVGMKSFTVARRVEPVAVLLLILLLNLSPISLPAQDSWPRWRGPQDAGAAMRGEYPVKWDANTVLWKTPLPGKGCSTPIVWQQRIYVTADRKSVV